MYRKQLGFRLTPKPLVWGGLAIVFLVLAVLSSRHYRNYRKARDWLRFRDANVTDEYRKFCDELDEKSETGLQSRLLADMIPLEIVGFIVALIGAIMEVVP
jgi:hypothetical protein